MMADFKITIIGAGSARFSAKMVIDLCLEKGLHGSHVCFMDIDKKRLDMIHKLAERLVKELSADLKLSSTTDRKEALIGADFVINTALDGGHTWVEKERNLAEKHGYYRGASLHIFRQSVFFLEVARDMEKICPEAWLLQSANPVFEGCTLMTRETKIKVIGLCHGHLSYRNIARVMDLDLKDITARTAGFNHWIWLTDFYYKNKDAYPLIDKWIACESESYWNKDDRHYMDNQMSKAAIHQYQLFGLMPIGDTPRFVGWWYHTNFETKQEWFGHMGGFDSEISWAKYLESNKKRILEIEMAARDEEKPITDTFHPSHSSEQIMPLINSLVNDHEGLYQVNIPNSGPLIKGFPEDLVVECQGVVNGTGIHGVSVPELPQKLMFGAMVPRWQKAELMLQALQTGERELLLLYFLEDHRTRGLTQVEILIDEWLSLPVNNKVAQLFP